MAVQESIKEALEANGVEYMGEASLKESVIKWLSNSANKAYFNAIIKDEFPTEFGGDDVDKIIEKLESYTQDKLLVVMNKIFNPTNPEALYRKCGFTGSDVWHVLRKR